MAKLIIRAGDANIEKASGRYAADLVLQLPARGSGSIAYVGAAGVDGPVSYAALKWLFQRHDFLRPFDR
jgi:hypothetical protein